MLTGFIVYKMSCYFSVP